MSTIAVSESGSSPHPASFGVAAEGIKVALIVLPSIGPEGSDQVELVKVSVKALPDCETVNAAFWPSRNFPQGNPAR